MPCRTAALLAGIVLSLAAGPVLANTADAAAAFAEGQALLAKSDFDGALHAFRMAATTGDDPQYMQHYALLRQVLRMRAACVQEQDHPRWLSMADALRTFYYDHHLYAEALPLDLQRYRQDPSAESATLLAETQLALGLNAQALDTLDDLPADAAGPRNRILHALALARLGQTKEAADVAASATPPPDLVDAAYFYDVARLQALLGNQQGAFEALTRAFELTPPDQLDDLKNHVTAGPDFTALASTAGFSITLQTQSKIKQSDCSKGAGCGKCPSRSKCGKQHAAAEDKGS